MPEWVIVCEANGEPHVLTSWCMDGGTSMPIAILKAQGFEPVVFRDRWRAKRFIRKRNGRTTWRAIRRDRL